MLKNEEKNLNNVFGSGLGLAICKGLADKMNFELKFISEYLIGSTFKIIIPCKIKKKVKDFEKQIPIHKLNGLKKNIESNISMNNEEIMNIFNNKNFIVNNSSNPLSKSYDFTNVCDLFYEKTKVVKKFSSKFLQDVNILISFFYNFNLLNRIN